LVPKQDYFEAGQLTDLAYIVLVSLTEPRHGYAIMNEVEAMTGGEIVIGPASLYTTLKKLADAGFIRPIGSAGSNRKTYEITWEGAVAMRTEAEKRRKLSDYGEAALRRFGADTLLLAEPENTDDNPDNKSEEEG
jgi:DNA-binding PadR family transcriptional regulator